MAIVKQTLAEWQAELKQRVGDPPDFAKLAFECPRCGNVATAKQFVDLGEKPDRAATNCIGRFLTADGDPGCDWAAYGVIDKGRVLSKPEGGTVQVFEFADAPIEVSTFIAKRVESRRDGRAGNTLEEPRDGAVAVRWDDGETEDCLTEDLRYIAEAGAMSTTDGLR